MGKSKDKLTIFILLFFIIFVVFLICLANRPTEKSSSPTKSYSSPKSSLTDREKKKALDEAFEKAKKSAEEYEIRRIKNKHFYYKNFW